jgi:hypothetical protein
LEREEALKGKHHPRKGSRQGNDKKRLNPDEVDPFDNESQAKGGPKGALSGLEEKKEHPSHLLDDKKARAPEVLDQSPVPLLNSQQDSKEKTAEFYPKTHAGERYSSNKMALGSWW